MDEAGVWAPVVYPNAAGFGGQRFGLHPDSMVTAAPGLASLDADTQRRVLQDNAAALYRIPLRG